MTKKYCTTVLKNFKSRKKLPRILNQNISKIVQTKNCLNPRPLRKFFFFFISFFKQSKLRFKTWKIYKASVWMYLYVPNVSFTCNVGHASERRQSVASRSRRMPPRQHHDHHDPASRSRSRLDPGRPDRSRARPQQQPPKLRHGLGPATAQVQPGRPQSHRRGLCPCRQKQNW